MRYLSVSQVAALGAISPAAVEAAFAAVIREGGLIPLAVVADVTRRTEDDLAASMEVIEL